jgi:type IX secretion system PorP/SprF family membrane protein
MKQYIFFLLAAVSFLPVQGQIQSFFQPSLQNPAAMGRSENVNVGFTAQHDMAGFDGSRTIASCAGDFPFIYHKRGQRYKKYMFLGFAMQNENFSVYNNFSAVVNYAYRMKIAKNHHLSFGLAVGILYEFKNYARFLQDGSSDPAILELMRNSKKNTIYFKGGVGIELSHPRYYVSLYVPNVVTVKELAPAVGGGFTTDPETNGSFAFDIKTGYDFGKREFIQEVKTWVVIKRAIGLGVGYAYPQYMSAFAFVNLKRTGLISAMVGYGCQINRFKFKIAGSPALTHEVILKLTFAKRGEE